MWSFNEDWKWRYLLTIMDLSTEKRHKNRSMYTCIPCAGGTWVMRGYEPNFATIRFKGMKRKQNFMTIQKRNKRRDATNEKYYRSLAQFNHKFITVLLQFPKNLGLDCVKCKAQPPFWINESTPDSPLNYNATFRPNKLTTLRPSATSYVYCYYYCCYFSQRHYFFLFNRCVKSWRVMLPSARTPQKQKRPLGRKR